MGNEIVDAAKQSTVPVTVSAVSMFGMQLADWMYILTMIYLTMQIVQICIKTARSWRR